MIRRPPRSTQSRSSAASDVYKRQEPALSLCPTTKKTAYGRSERWRVVKLRPEEIASVLKSQIENYQAEVEVEEVGTVLEVGDGIARIYGLRNAMAAEMLDLPHQVTGLVLNLEEDNVLSLIHI